MATTPTQLPVPSEKPQDLKFNVGKIDEYVTSMGWTYADRFGNKHYTIEGINYLAQQVMNAFGYITLTGVNFDTGATVSTPNEVLFNPADNSYYKWSGSFASGPKVVPENATPETTGGVGPGKWLNVGDTVLRNQLSSLGGFSFIGQCGSVVQLRSVEPSYIGQKILVSSHTEGVGYGGGEFSAILDGSSYADDNGNYIKTSSGAVWIREKKDYAYAADYGLIVNDPSKTVSNSAAIVDAAKYAFENGTDVWLPFGMKYIDDVVLNHPVTIRANRTMFGAALVNRNQNTDIIHTGSGFAFDFTPQIRPTTAASPEDVTDSPALIGLSIRGTNAGKAAWRVNSSAVISDERYARRNFVATDVQVAGYYSGYGFQMFWTFTNKLTNVTVWDCAVTYYMRSAYATEHFGCVYENSSFGCLAINCNANNHFGGAVEGIRKIAAHTQPADYDTAGGLPDGDYSGIGFRVRGGNTTMFGGYVEANVVHAQTENQGDFSFDGTYINNGSLTRAIARGVSGRYRQVRTRIEATPVAGFWVNAGTGLGCVYAEIHSNAFISATKPATVPSIAVVGEFDIYDGTLSDANAARRVFLGQDLQVGGYQVNSGSPREIYAEIYDTRVANAGSSTSDRVVDIGNLTTVSGQITALQGAGTLTIINTKASIAKEGREMSFIINASGPCSLAFGAGFRMATSSPIGLNSGQTAVVSFVSQANNFYQKGTTNILLT